MGALEFSPSPEILKLSMAIIVVHQYFAAQWFHNVAHVCVFYFHVFNFRCLSKWRKIFNVENLPIYRSLAFMLLNVVVVRLTVAASHILRVLSSEADTRYLESWDHATSDMP